MVCPIEFNSECNNFDHKLCCYNLRILAKMRFLTNSENSNIKRSGRDGHNWMVFLASEDSHYLEKVNGILCVKMLLPSVINPFERPGKKTRHQSLAFFHPM